MRGIVAIFALSLLAGCETELDPCRGYGCEYDSKTDLGIRYRDDIGDDTAITKQEIDDSYLRVFQCTGVWVDPDLYVVATNRVPKGNDGYYWGTAGAPSFIVIGGGARADRSFLMMHEFLHHYFYATYGDLDGDHSDALWSRCLKTSWQTINQSL